MGSSRREVSEVVLTQAGASCLGRGSALRREFHQGVITSVAVRASELVVLDAVSSAKAWRICT